ncbi:MAG: hypothetical protein ACQEVA_05090 [Myxococcota bacterium]
MKSLRIQIAAVLAVALAFGTVACENKKTDDASEKEAESEPAEQKDEKEEQKPEASGPDPAEPHSSSIPGTQNQLEWDQDVPNVTFELVAPEDGATLESGDEVSVEFSMTNYRTGEEIGQHVHVILDNNPYIAHYDANEPLVLEDVEPGTHTIRAFPARHYHLALKEGDVFKTATFHVEEKSEEFDFDPSKPYLTYSRPKGTYSVEAAKELLLDFYVTNIELGEDAKAVVTVDDGEPQEFTEWKPQLLEPMEAGEHEVNLKLVDGDGNLIENGGYNNTTRTITVK